MKRVYNGDGHLSYTPDAIEICFDHNNTATSPTICTLSTFISGTDEETDEQANRKPTCTIDSEGEYR